MNDEPPPRSAGASALDADGGRRTLRGFIVPMGVALVLAGSVGIVDTFYLSLLGDRALTAFSFILPVLVGSQQLCLGFGIGVTSVVSRARGAGDREAADRLAAHTCAMAAVLAAALELALFATRRTLFRALGATDAEEALVEEFTHYWTPGVAFVAFTTWSTALLRGSGETRTTALVMLVQAAVVSSGAFA